MPRRAPPGCAGRRRWGGGGGARRRAPGPVRDGVAAGPLWPEATPSSGIALRGLVPALVAFKQGGMDDDAAAIATWQLGAASLVVMGVLKFVLSFFGEAVTRIAPRAALLGSIAGIALVLMRSEEHTSELQSLMRTSYAVFCLKKKRTIHEACHETR